MQIQNNISYLYFFSSFFIGGGVLRQEREREREREREKRIFLNSALIDKGYDNFNRKEESSFSLTE